MVPVRTVVVGTGNMGAKWMSAVQQAPGAELVGAVELDTTLARRRLDELGLDRVPAADSLPDLLAHGGVDAVVNTTIPAAHLEVSSTALRGGAAVISEKPAAATLAEALALAATSVATGRLCMVSQSRRYNPRLERYAEAVARLGDIGTVSTEFFRAPHFGGFREQMPSPLLVDMAIHPFDSARFLIGREPVAVYAEEYNPSWSWFNGDAAASVLVEFEGGLRWVYTGSWCSPGAETSWNGSWRVSGERGTALWNGDDEPELDIPDQADAAAPAPPERDGLGGIEAALDVFLHTLADGGRPRGEIRENVRSLAMVEAALVSSSRGRRVTLDEVLEEALEDARSLTLDPETSAVLREVDGVDALLGGAA
jgi:predicted dehydrogenase